jgi:hypothetical protein
MNNLWSQNTPQNFWCCQETIADDLWHAAVHTALPILGLPDDADTSSTSALLAAILGEGRFGAEHWELSPAKRIYYNFKPYMPRFLIRLLRRLYSIRADEFQGYNWPIEDRYVHFQWEVIKQVIQQSGRKMLHYRHFWPHGRRFAFVLTHDVEAAIGRDYVLEVAELEQQLGFRSSFNFVPERYHTDEVLIQTLRNRGFEVGVHGLKHDGKLFRSQREFMQRAKKINTYIHQFGAAGFRTPLTHRQPEWIQTLDLEYDLSFFDTDPYEPMPGGTMSIWPFQMGRFIELPYTLVQDYTLTRVLSETTPRIWLDKVDFLSDYYGMALVNAHPDYLRDADVWQVYKTFLHTIKERDDYWHALPRDVAHWWRMRMCSQPNSLLPDATLGTLTLENDNLVIVSETRVKQMGEAYRLPQTEYLY